MKWMKSHKIKFGHLPLENVHHEYTYLELVYLIGLKGREQKWELFFIEQRIEKRKLLTYDQMTLFSMWPYELKIIVEQPIYQNS